MLKSNTGPSVPWAWHWGAKYFWILPKTGRSSPQQKPILLCKYLLPTFTFSLLKGTSLHYCGNSRKHCQRQGSSGGGRLCWRQSNSLVKSAATCCLVNTPWDFITFIGIQPWMIGWSAFVQNFPDCFLQFYDIIHPSCPRIQSEKNSNLTFNTLLYWSWQEQLNFNFESKLNIVIKYHWEWNICILIKMLHLNSTLYGLLCLKKHLFGYRKAIEQVVYSSYSFPIKGQLLRFQSPIEDHIWMWLFCHLYAFCNVFISLFFSRVLSTRLLHTKCGFYISFYSCCYSMQSHLTQQGRGIIISRTGEIIG